jgi:endonuclease IV
MSIGIHISKDKKYETKNNTGTIEYILQKYPKMGCFQIYSHGPRNRRPVNIDASRVRRIVSEYKRNCYIHSTYPTTWKTTDENINHILHQFITAHVMSAKGVVIHLPKDTCENVVNKIPILFSNVVEYLEDKKDFPKILLEVRSIRPSNESFESPEKLINLIEAIKLNPDISRLGINNSDYIGLVIDTAHIYAGLQNITSYREGRNYVKKLKNYKDWFPLLHLNGNGYDAKIRAGDRHECPMSSEDKIWGGVDDYLESGARAFIEWHLKNKADIILELKRPDPTWMKFMNNIITLYKL